MLLNAVWSQEKNRQQPRLPSEQKMHSQNGYHLPAGLIMTAVARVGVELSPTVAKSPTPGQSSLVLRQSQHEVLGDFVDTQVDGISRMFTVRCYRRVFSGMTTLPASTCIRPRCADRTCRHLVTSFQQRDSMLLYSGVGVQSWKREDRVLRKEPRRSGSQAHRPRQKK